MIDLTQGRQTEKVCDPAREDAQRVQQVSGALLSRVSHELRTPLNVILGFAQLLEKGAATADQRESAQQILEAGRQLLDLVDELLDLSLLEAGQLRLSIEPVSVREVVSEAVERVRPLAIECRIGLCPDGIAAGDADVLADRRRLQQVLASLLSNGIQYNWQEGAVRVAWGGGAPGRLRLKVSDTGPGIPDEKLARLFTPFDRLDAERTAVQGAGLGLALARRLVEAMGGTLAVESAVGEGSCFSVELPLARTVPAGDEVATLREGRG